MADTSNLPTLTVVDHPLIRHKLTLMRKLDTPTPMFRALLKDIGALMTFEATRNLELDAVDVETPVCRTQGHFLRKPAPLVVPILRAGMGLADGVLTVMSEADVGYIGVYRDEETLRPVEYLAKLPADLVHRTIIVTDPMLATGHSGAHALHLLIEAGAKPSSIVFMALVAAPEGVRVIAEEHPEVKVIAASLDEGLNEHAYIVPGLGDAGDRLYGTC